MVCNNRGRDRGVSDLIGEVRGLIIDKGRKVGVCDHRGEHMKNIYLTTSYGKNPRLKKTSKNTNTLSRYKDVYKY